MVLHQDRDLDLPFRPLTWDLTMQKPFGKLDKQEKDLTTEYCRRLCSPQGCLIFVVISVETRTGDLTEKHIWRKLGQQLESQNP